MLIDKLIDITFDEDRVSFSVITDRNLEYLIEELTKNGYKNVKVTYEKVVNLSGVNEYGIIAELNDED